MKKEWLTSSTLIVVEYIAFFEVKIYNYRVLFSNFLLILRVVIKVEFLCRFWSTSGMSCD